MDSSPAKGCTKDLPIGLVDHYLRFQRMPLFLAAAIAEFDEWSLPQVENFIAYLHKHQSRIPDYWYFQSEQISSIGSGSIESTIKQIGRRVKISLAQWNKYNRPLA